MRLTATYLRNFVFGVEDGLVSTVGLLTGIAIGGVSRQTLILTGIVLVVVEAFSMAVGSFLSEASTEELDARTTSGSVTNRSVRGGVVMFVSYFVAGFVPLAPYFVVAGSSAVYLSIALSLVALFALGVVNGWFAKGRMLWRGLRMMLVGGLAVVVGVAAALVLAQYGVVA